jgi:hypothetical protein
MEVPMICYVCVENLIVKKRCFIMQKISLILTTLLLIGVFQLKSQNVCEIYCSSYNEGKLLKNVTFRLTNNGKAVGEVLSKAGDFQFAIKEGDGAYILNVMKAGFITKTILFNTEGYPFAHEYEIQDIDIEFHVQKTGDEEAQVGEMRWNSIGDVFSVVKIDGLPSAFQPVINDPEERFGLIYAQAIASADALFANNEIAAARGDYQLALLAKPEDKEAQVGIAKMDSILAVAKSNEKVIDADIIDQINKGELDHVDLKNSDENVIYSVQLGAFSKKVNAMDFQHVPEFRAIPYDDYTRCFSGEFTDINLAIKRKKDMVGKGYKDAWIVKMKGNKRLDF